MRLAHFYVYSDACPTDWLEANQDTRWHTIVNFIFQSDPALQSLIVDQKPAHEVLEQDHIFNSFRASLESRLSSNRLRKWTTGPSYREKFCHAFASIVSEFKPIVNAISFQEQTLRSSKQALLSRYNELVGGVEVSGIGFEAINDSRGRTRMKHSFVNFFGYHEIEGLENQILPLLLMSVFVADQYGFYHKDLFETGGHGFDTLQFTVVSDKLSGDDDVKQKMIQNVRHLVDPEHITNPITITRSPKSDFYAGDLIVDNLAGWLNAAISEPDSEFAIYARQFMSNQSWISWKELLPSTTKLLSRPVAISILRQDS